MCLDRVQNGMLPACVQSCPTGTMNFGEREEMLEMGRARLEVVKKTKPGAVLVDAEYVNVVYLCEYDPSEYYEFVTVDAGPSLLGRRRMFAKLLSPIRAMG